MAPSSRKASWSGWWMPSMVVICLPAAARTGVMQERTGWPSRSTVQAPHWPSPHPYLAPVSERWSRSTVSKGISGSASMGRRVPFTVSWVTLGIRLLCHRRRVIEYNRSSMKSVLTPLDFLARSAWVYRDRIAVVDGERRFTYAELNERVHRQAGALRALGVVPGDRVAVLAPNRSEEHTSEL